MIKILYLVFALMGGMALSLQAGINGALGKRIGTLEGAFISFVVGTLVLLILVLSTGNGNLSKIMSVPKWQFLGGILGVVYLTIMIAIVPKIGVASSIMAVIAGQMAVSMTLDHFGIFTNQRIPIDGYRLGGILLLAAALFLIHQSSLRNL